MVLPFLDFWVWLSFSCVSSWITGEYECSSSFFFSCFSCFDYVVRFDAFVHPVGTSSFSPFHSLPTFFLGCIFVVHKFPFQTKKVRSENPLSNRYTKTIPFLGKSLKRKGHLLKKDLQLVLEQCHYSEDPKIIPIPPSKRVWLRRDRFEDDLEVFHLSQGFTKFFILSLSYVRSFYRKICWCTSTFLFH